jgi:cobaltochelatase CobS
MKTFNARFPGKCAWCATSFPRGTEVVWDRTRRGVIAHASCFQSNGEKFPSNPSPSTISHEEITPVTETTVATSNYQANVPANDLAATIAAAVSPLVQVSEQRIKDIVHDMILNEAAVKIDEADVVRIIEEHTKATVKTIEIKNPVTGETRNIGQQHKQFERLLQLVSARDHKGYHLNIWITGPAGSGKTTAAEKCAEALGLPYALTGSLTESYKLYGFVSPGTGQYVRTPFRDIWENGGVFICDDFDGSDPNCAIEFNAPFANGMCAFPDGMIPRHKDTVIILTANTWGHGGTDDYVGRLKQDKAFLNRFVKIHWETDEELELATCPDTQWCKRVQSIRCKVSELGIKALITPRASYYGAALLAAGVPRNEVEDHTLRFEMSAEQWRSVC